MARAWTGRTAWRGRYPAWNTTDPRATATSWAEWRCARVPVPGPSTSRPSAPSGTTRSQATTSNKCSCRSRSTASRTAAEVASAGRSRRLLLHVQGLGDSRHHLTLGVGDVHDELREVLLAAGGVLEDLLHFRLRDLEARGDGAAAGLQVLDLGTPVPHVV